MRLGSGVVLTGGMVLQLVSVMPGGRCSEVSLGLYWLGSRDSPAAVDPAGRRTVTMTT